MAKKSFKSGLGSLIQDSSIEFAQNGMTNEFSQKDSVQLKIEQLQDELKLWRTGKLNLEKFEKTLKENHLKYNPATNSFEKTKA